MKTDNPKELLQNAQVIHSHAEVQMAISKVSRDVTALLEFEKSIVICVMGGGVVFAGQLLTQLNFPLELDYVHASTLL